MTAYPIAEPPVVFQADEVIVLDLVDELAQLAFDLSNHRTADFLRSRNAGYRESPTGTWLELSDRRTAILGAPGLLEMLDLGLLDQLDQVRAELIIDQLWTGRLHDDRQ
ncbi:MAG: hypothetical protein JWM76_1343 [Pseudonocardiales bacterium]|nr:hypothetical protein [Pseudonocardiales bacterium]